MSKAGTIVKTMKSLPGKFSLFFGLTTLLCQLDVEVPEECKDWMGRVRAIGFFMKPKLMVKLKEKEGSAEEFRQWELAHGLDNAAPDEAKLEVESL